MRFMQMMLVVTVSIVSFFVVQMFDRLDSEFAGIGGDIQRIESDNQIRDERLATLMLEIESRLSILETKSGWFQLGGSGKSFAGNLCNTAGGIMLELQFIDSKPSSSSQL